MTEQERIDLAAQCPDLAYFRPVEGAGFVVEKNGRRVQKTHYGGHVLADGYYGVWMTNLIALLNGVHEPQEERVFAEILPAMPEAPRMLELGGYWAFYSIWLKMVRPRAEITILEPIDERRLTGETNVALNGFEASFIRGAIGDVPGHAAFFENGPANSNDLDIFSVDQLIAERGWPCIDVLHADIQGHENRMLRGAENALANKTVKWFFISTHRWLEEGKTIDLHQTCLDTLTSAGYHIVSEHTPEQSYTVDGLIVAKAPGVGGVDQVGVSTRPDAT